MSNLCVSPSPKAKTSFFLLIVCVDEPLSLLKIVRVLTQLKFGIKKSASELKQIPYSELKYLWRSAFLLSLTALNNKCFNIKSACKSLDHTSYLWIIKKITAFP